MTPAGPVTLLFTDLVNSIELLQRAGDEQAQRIFQAHHKLLKNAVAAHGGQEVKWLGDGLMAVFASPADAVRCAIEMQQAARRRVAAERLAIRVGLNVGDALREETDYFGLPVVIARRLCDHAQGGQILCSALVTGLLAGRQAFTFRDCGALALKGVAAPVAASEVLYQHDAPAALLSHTPFVGRVTELTKLTQKLQEARAGQGGLVLLAGEPGIGKTRTLEEFAELARERGARVLIGRCYEGEWAPPYGPFAEALALHVREANLDELRQDLGLGAAPWAAPLARLVPVLREKLPDIPEPVALQPDEERFRLLDAVAQFLIAVSTRAPVVLMLDDLHWADKGTIVLLRHVARCAARERLLLLGGYRDVEVERTHPLAEALGALPRETRYEHLALTGLDTGEVAQLLETIADQEVPAALVTTIRAETSGNPFFIREVLLHLVEEGKILRRDGRWTAIGEVGIPDSVRQVIAGRLSHISPEANRLLSVGSAFNGAFRFDIAARVAGLPEAKALDAIDEALGAQLLEPSSQADTCDFTHALVRHTLYEQLSAPRQVRLHRQIAETMEQTYDNLVGEHAAALAEQYHRSKDLPGAERGVTYAVAAADRAETMYAHDEVVRLLRIAVDLTPPTAPRPARLLGRLALALTWALNFDEAVQAAHKAGELIAATEGAAAAADYLGEATINFAEAGSLQSAWKVAREGMAYIGARRDLTWLRLASYDVMRREQEDAQYPGIPLDSPERREMGVLVGSLSPDDLSGIFCIPTASRGEVLRLWPQVQFFNMWTGDFRGSLEVLEEWATRCEREGRINSAAIYFSGVARCRLALGEIAGADEAYAHAVALLDRLRVSSPRAALAFTAYRFERCSVVNEGWGELVSRAAIHAKRPDAENLSSFAATQAATAVTLAWLGRTERALEMLTTLPAALDRAPAWSPSYTAIACNAAAALWSLERTKHAECIERNLREKVIAPDFRTPMQDGRLALGQVCALQRRYDEAAEWFARARVALDEQGARPLRAIVDYDEALMYVRRGAAGDAKRAAPLLEAALAQFRDIGMPGWIRCAEHLLREGREWKPAAQPKEQPPPRAVLGETGDEFGAPATSPGATPLAKGVRPSGAPAANPTDYRAEPEPREGRHSLDRGVAPGESPAADDASIFRQEGEYWTLAYHGQTARLRDTKGLHYIARLLAQPGRDLHVRDLATVGQRSDPSNGSRPARVEGDLGAILDARATAQYKERLAEARQELDEATAAGDLGQAELLQHEIESLTEQLSAAYGLGGRPRTAGDPAERVRKAVTNQIRRALDRICAAHPELGRHLTNALRTGFVCAYRPEHPVAWRR